MSIPVDLEEKRSLCYFKKPGILRKLSLVTELATCKFNFGGFFLPVKQSSFLWPQRLCMSVCETGPEDMCCVVSFAEREGEREA